MPANRPTTTVLQCTNDSHTERFNLKLIQIKLFQPDYFTSQGSHKLAGRLTGDAYALLMCPIMSAWAAKSSKAWLYPNMGYTALGTFLA